MSPRPILRADGVEAVVDPAHGGRLASLRIDGREILVTDGAGSMTWGLYPMAPWAGRLRDGLLAWRGATHHLPTTLAPPHAIHGTLIEAAWQLVSATDRVVELAARLVHPWPFAGRAVHRLALADGHLEATLRVESDEVEFPAIVGWHPWFRRTLRERDGRQAGEPAAIDLPAGGMLIRGADGLPTGEVARPIPPGPWDDCFVDLAGPPSVRWEGVVEIAIESEAAFWVCYTEPEHAVCIEPQTGPPNGLSTGQHAVVKPGSPLEAAMVVRWRRLFRAPAG